MADESHVDACRRLSVVLHAHGSVQHVSGQPVLVVSRGGLVSLFGSLSGRTIRGIPAFMRRQSFTRAEVSHGTFEARASLSAVCEAAGVRMGPSNLDSVVDSAFAELSALAAQAVVPVPAPISAHPDLAPIVIVDSDAEANDPPH
eukprot:13368207-Alexandrium_andersonii.AAC.1